MKEEIIEIIAAVAEIPARKVKLDSNLVSDLGLESLDLIELVSTFEEKFDLEVEDKDIKDFQTVGDVVSYIESHVQNIH